MENEQWIAQTSNDVTIINDFPASSLLTQNLRIPKYQRPYCWTSRNVEDFLKDICEFQTGRHDACYHAGTIILYSMNDFGKDVFFDVVDGQQRLTTLAILCHIRNKGAYYSDKTIIPLINNQSKDYYGKKEIQSLLRAEFIMNSDKHLKRITNGIDLDRIVFSVVIIGSDQPLDQAYTFFSNNNSTGKRLSDYDLLKTHHLRYVDGEKKAEQISQKWHAIERVENRQDDLLQKMLFRLRKWETKEKFEFESADSDEHRIFLHFKGYDEMHDFPTCKKSMFRFNSLLSGGEEFFSYVDYYNKKYGAFCELRAVKLLKKYLDGHSHNVLLEAIEALSFLYYCKFGDFYIEEAIYLLADKISALRNENRITRSMIGNNKKEDAKQGVFLPDITQTLNHVTSASQFFNYLHSGIPYEITQDKNVKKTYWTALSSLYRELTMNTFENIVKISH